MVNIIYKCKWFALWMLCRSRPHAYSYIRAACCCVFHTLKVEKREKDMKSLPPKVEAETCWSPSPTDVASTTPHCFPCCSTLDVWIFPFVLAVIEFVCFLFFPSLPTSLDGFAWESKSRRKIQVASPQWFNVSHLGLSGLCFIECQGNIENKVWGYFSPVFGVGKLLNTFPFLFAHFCWNDDSEIKLWTVCSQGCYRMISDFEVTCELTGSE